MTFLPQRHGSYFEPRDRVTMFQVQQLEMILRELERGTPGLRSACVHLAYGALHALTCLTFWAELCFILRVLSFQPHDTSLGCKSYGSSIFSHVRPALRMIMYVQMCRCSNLQCSEEMTGCVVRFRIRSDHEK